MRLFGKVDSTINRFDRAWLLSIPFDAAFNQTSHPGGRAAYVGSNPRYSATPSVSAKYSATVNVGPKDSATVSTFP